MKLECTTKSRIDRNMFMTPKHDRYQKQIFRFTYLKDDVLKRAYLFINLIGRPLQLDNRAANRFVTNIVNSEYPATRKILSSKDIDTR